MHAKHIIYCLLLVYTSARFSTTSDFAVINFIFMYVACERSQIFCKTLPNLHTLPASIDTFQYHHTETRKDLVLEDQHQKVKGRKAKSLKMIFHWDQDFVVLSPSPWKRFHVRDLVWSLIFRRNWAFVSKAIFLLLIIFPSGPLQDLANECTVSLV